MYVRYAVVPGTTVLLGLLAQPAQAQLACWASSRSHCEQLLVQHASCVLAYYLRCAVQVVASKQAATVTCIRATRNGKGSQFVLLLCFWLITSSLACTVGLYSMMWHSV